MFDNLTTESRTPNLLYFLDRELDEIGFQVSDIQVKEAFILRTGGSNEIRNFLTSYFVHGFKRIYPDDSRDLRFALIDIMKRAITSGKCSLEVTWDKYEDRSGTSYILPIQSDYLDGAMMSRESHNEKITPDQAVAINLPYYQKIVLEPPSNLRTNDHLHILFRQRERLESQYITKLEIDSSQRVNGFWRELLRNKDRAAIEREYRLANEKFRSAMHLPIDHGSPLQLSDYYKAHRLVDFVSYCQELRSLLLNWFTDAILTKVVELNELDIEIGLVYAGPNYDEEQLASWLEGILNGELSYIDLVREVYKFPTEE